MSDWRTKIAALLVVLGLGGLGGYAASSNRSQGATSASAPVTEVIRRTVHAKPHRARPAGDRPAASPTRSLASEPVSTGTSGGSSGTSSVRTGSSGAASGGEREDAEEGGEGGDD